MVIRIIRHLIFPSVFVIVQTCITIYNQKIKFATIFTENVILAINKTPQRADTISNGEPARNNLQVAPLPYNSLASLGHCWQWFDCSALRFSQSNLPSAAAEGKAKPYKGGTMDAEYTSTFQMRLTPGQLARLKAKARRAAVSMAEVIRHWIDNKDVIEQVAVFDKEAVAEIKRISGMIHRSFNVLDKMQMTKLSTFNAQMAVEAVKAYQDFKDFLKQYRQRLP